MTTTTTEQRKITITLSDRAPARIVSKDWPTIARADWYSGQYECQANEIARIKVRQHADGRAIVYGVRERGPGGMPRGYRDTAAGFVVDGDGSRLIDPGDGPLVRAPNASAIIRAIRRVAGAIDMPELGDECIGDLPAEDLR